MHEFAVIRDYLEREVYPGDYDKVQKRSLRQQVTSFAMYDGQLHHKNRNGILCRVVETVQEQQCEMLRGHGDVGAAFHSGQTATLEKIMQR